MEIEKRSLKTRLAALFLREKIPFAKKADVNWGRVRNCLLAAVGLALLVVLLLPAPRQDEATFHEKMEPESGAAAAASRSPDPTEDTLRTLRGDGTSRSVAYSSGGHSGGGEVDRAAPMILSRNGSDSKTQIPPGARVSVRLKETATVTSQGMPVIGLVTRDFVQEESLAVPAGSKLMGTASLDAGGDRAHIEWQAIQLPDGHSRQIAAAGVGFDGQLGVPGNGHSNVAENTIGATLSRFIGAYAEGAMERGSFGGNPGGANNGWKNAVAETAKDRADAFAEGLKKEKHWLELSPSVEFYAVLTAPFTFRDPGGMNGR
jgi:type IV secretory pathway VirB10-like protein